MFTWLWKKPEAPPPSVAVPPTAAVLVDGIALGYRLAWDTMMPLMLDGIKRSRETLRNLAYQEAVSTVEGAIRERVASQVADIERLRQYDVVQTKHQELSQKRDTAPTPGDRERYGYYLEALEWLLNGRTPRA